MPSIARELGDLLKVLQGEASGEEIAVKWDVTPGALSKYKSGQTLPRANVIDHILEIEGFTDYAEFFSHGKAELEPTEKDMLDFLKSNGIQSLADLKLHFEYLSAFRQTLSYLIQPPTKKPPEE